MVPVPATCTCVCVPVYLDLCTCTCLYSDIIARQSLFFLYYPPYLAVYLCTVQGPDTRRTTRPADDLPVGGLPQPRQPPALGDGFPANMRVAAIRQRAVQGQGGDQEQGGDQDQQGGDQEQQDLLQQQEQLRQQQEQQARALGLRNHVSGLGQMLNPLNTCFASADVQVLVAMEVDLNLDGTVARGALQRILDQVLCVLSNFPSAFAFGSDTDIKKATIS